MRLSHRFLLFLLSVLAPLVAAAQYRMMPAMPAPEREVRAVWLTTLMGLDWPRTKANSDERRQRQKDELLRTLDALERQLEFIGELMEGSRRKNQYAMLIPGFGEMTTPLETGTSAKRLMDQAYHLYHGSTGHNDVFLSESYRRDGMFVLDTLLK